MKVVTTRAAVPVAILLLTSALPLAAQRSEARPAVRVGKLNRIQERGHLLWPKDACASSNDADGEGVPSAPAPPSSRLCVVQPARDAIGTLPCCGFSDEATRKSEIAPPGTELNPTDGVAIRSIVGRGTPIAKREPARTTSYLPPWTPTQTTKQGKQQGQRRSPPTSGLDRQIRTFFLTEVLELAPAVAGTPVRIDGTGWIGGDYNRIWLRLDGEVSTERNQSDLAAELNYGRLVSPFWTALSGVRVESAHGGDGERATRALLALGFEGMAPFWFTMEPSLYVSTRGDVSARFASTFDLLLTQRLVLQPRLELHAAVQQVPSFGIGSGINDVELGARVRYEIRRELAPYVGVFWFRRAGGAASLARQARESVREAGLVAGLRVWR